MKKILFLASGSGSNIENIITYFQNKNIKNDYQIVCNVSHAGVFERAKRLNVSVTHFTKAEINGEVFEQFVQEYAPDLIVLAGFLSLFPNKIIQQFPNKIINIHPALLPKYGGKGMYGMFVHRAVIQNNEQETGITIHYVNEQYDKGAIILQAKTDISNCQTPEEVAQAVHQLEYKHFPVIIQKLLNL